MNKKSYFLGVVTGIVLTFVGLLVLNLVKQNSDVNNQVQYLDKPVSYENKKETSFKVFQVFDNVVLAKEVSDKVLNYVEYRGNTVILMGENYYSDQIISVKNPQRIGTYSYTNNGGIPMTVPIIEGEME